MLAAARSQCLLAFLTLVTGLGCASCGSTVTLPAGRSLPIALSEYRIRPSHVAVPAGTLTIHVRNYGRLTHDLVITRLTQAGTRKLISDSGGLSPGRSRTLTVTLAPGTYRMASDIAVDQSVGDTGTLTVASK